MEGNLFIYISKDSELTELLSVAKTHVYNHNFGQAVEVLEQVVENYQTSVEGYNLLAYAYKMSLGNTPDAQQKSLEVMNKALEINPNNTLTLFNLASTYYELHEFGKAVNYYQLLVNSNKINDYRVYFNLAMCYEKLSDNLKATENYQQALKLNPDFSSAVINYSNLLMSMGKHTQAKYILEHYLKGNRNDMRALNNLNIILAERQIDQKVEENFKKISQGGAITSVYNNGVFLSKQGKFQEALSVFKSLVERLQDQQDEPLLLLSHVNQGVLYEKTNNHEQAISKYVFIIENFGSSINLEEFQNRISEVKARDREKNRVNFIPKLPQQAMMSKTGTNFSGQQFTPILPQKSNQLHNQKLAVISKNNFVNQKQKTPEKRNDDYMMNKPAQQLQPISIQKNKSSLIQKEPIQSLDEYQMIKKEPIQQILAKSAIIDTEQAQSNLEQQDEKPKSALKIFRRPSTSRSNKPVSNKNLDEPDKNQTSFINQSEDQHSFSNHQENTHPPQESVTNLKNDQPPEERAPSSHSKTKEVVGGPYQLISQEQVVEFQASKKEIPESKIDTSVRAEDESNIVNPLVDEFVINQVVSRVQSSRSRITSEQKQPSGQNIKQEVQTIQINTSHDNQFIKLHDNPLLSSKTLQYSIEDPKSVKRIIHSGQNQPSINVSRTDQEEKTPGPFTPSPFQQVSSNQQILSPILKKQLSSTSNKSSQQRQGSEKNKPPQDQEILPIDLVRTIEQEIIRPLSSKGDSSERGSIKYKIVSAEAPIQEELVQNLAPKIVSQTEIPEHHPILTPDTQKTELHEQHHPKKIQEQKQVIQPTNVTTSILVVQEQSVQQEIVQNPSPQHSHAEPENIQVNISIDVIKSQDPILSSQKIEINQDILVQPDQQVIQVQEVVTIEKYIQQSSEHQIVDDEKKQPSDKHLNSKDQETEQEQQIAQVRKQSEINLTPDQNKTQPLDENITTHQNEQIPHRVEHIQSEQHDQEIEIKDDQKHPEHVEPKDEHLDQQELVPEIQPQSEQIVDQIHEIKPQIESEIAKSNLHPETAQQFEIINVRTHENYPEHHPIDEQNIEQQNHDIVHKPHVELHAEPIPQNETKEEHANEQVKHVEPEHQAEHTNHIDHDEQTNEHRKKSEHEKPIESEQTHEHQHETVIVKPAEPTNEKPDDVKEETNHIDPQKLEDHVHPIHIEPVSEQTQVEVVQKVEPEQQVESVQQVEPAIQQLNEQQNEADNKEHVEPQTHEHEILQVNQVEPSNEQNVDHEVEPVKLEEPIQTNEHNHESETIQNVESIKEQSQEIELEHQPEKQIEPVNESVHEQNQEAQQLHHVEHEKEHPHQNQNEQEDRGEQENESNIEVKHEAEPENHTENQQNHVDNQEVEQIEPINEQNQASNLEDEQVKHVEPLKEIHTEPTNDQNHDQQNELPVTVDLVIEQNHQTILQENIEPEDVQNKPQKYELEHIKHLEPIKEQDTENEQTLNQNTQLNQPETERVKQIEPSNEQDQKQEAINLEVDQNHEHQEEIKVTTPIVEEEQHQEQQIETEKPIEEKPIQAEIAQPLEQENQEVVQQIATVEIEQEAQQLIDPEPQQVQEQDPQQQIEPEHQQEQVNQKPEETEVEQPVEQDTSKPNEEEKQNEEDKEKQQDQEPEKQREPQKQSEPEKQSEPQTEQQPEQTQQTQVVQEHEEQNQASAATQDVIEQPPTDVQEIPGDQLINNVDKIESVETKEPADTEIKEEGSEVIQKKKKKLKQQIQYPEDFNTWDMPTCLQKIEEDATNIFPYFRLAIIFIEQSEIQEAKKYLLQVFSMNPEFEAEKVNYGLGEVFESEKDWLQSSAHFKNAYPYTSKKQDCLVKIARCYAKIQDYEHAERTYQKAVEVNNKNYFPYFKLGCMMVKIGQIKGGIDNLLKASCLEPQNIEILIKLGEGYLMHEDEESAVDDAIQTFEQGLQVDPKNYDCTISLAKAYEQKQDLNQAIIHAKSATLQPNSNVNSYFYLGTLYMKKKELKQASEAFRTLLKHNSEHVDALIEYATILSLQGNHDKAKKYFRHSLKFDPNNVTANIRLGKIFQTKLKDLQSAIDCFTKITKSDPTNFKAHYFIGLCYIEQLDYKRATECMKEALKINPRFNLAWKAIGNILYETNSPSKAQKYYQRALECDATDLEAKIGLANCHYLLEEFEQAINLYEEIGQIDQNEELEYNLANCYYMRNEYDDAIRHYQKALLINPKKTECYYNLGNAFCIQEKFEDALLCFENSIQHDPTHSAALYNLANTHYVLNDHQNAAKYFEIAIELQPDNVDWRNYVSSLYLERGDLQEAKRHIDESLKVSISNADTFVRLSNYCKQTGNTKEAISNVKTALNLVPEHEEALELLADLEK